MNNLTFILLSIPEGAWAFGGIIVFLLACGIAFFTKKKS